MGFSNSTEREHDFAHPVMKFDKTTLCAVIVLVCVLAVAGTAYLGGQGSLTLKHGDHTLTFDLQADSNTRALIERLFEDEADRVTTLSILRELYDVHVVDNHLIDRIREEDPASDFSQAAAHDARQFPGAVRAGGA